MRTYHVGCGGAFQLGFPIRQTCYRFLPLWEAENEQVTNIPLSKGDFEAL